MKFIRSLFIITILFTFNKVYNQNQYHCGTDIYIERFYNQNPNLRFVIDSINNQHRNDVRKKNGQSDYDEIIIPVVVHVIYDTVSGSVIKHKQNISDYQIYSAIETLNKDFNLLNEDKLNIPNAFKNIAGIANLHFVLANRDPLGNYTTGITRTPTNVTSWNLDDKVKYTKYGGKDPWNVSKYLNIWVCNLDDGNVAGYSTLPEMTLYNSGFQQGVVIKYNLFGSVGTAADYARVVTHEVGHWVGLYHIWGDFDGCSSVYDDYIDDTPIQRKENYGCPSYPSQSCSSPSDMFMNYMDYTDSYCQNMFTKGQVDWLRKRIDYFRKGIKTSNGYTGIDKKLFENTLSIYPNPAKDVINIDFAFKNNIYYYEITDVNSLIVKKDKLTSNKVILNNLPEGVYFFRIYNDSVNLVKKFVILQ